MNHLNFRAWNMVTGTMIDLRKISPLALRDGMEGIFIPDVKDGNALVVMQSSGMGDSQKKEIYRDDVIQGIGQPFVVEWLEGAFVCNNGASFKPYLCDVLYNDKECKVIGNIHQNPNLIPPK